MNLTLIKMKSSLVIHPLKSHGFFCTIMKSSLVNDKTGKKGSKIVSKISLEIGTLIMYSFFGFERYYELNFLW